MEIKKYAILDDQKNAILSYDEDHFGDLKAKEIAPSKLSRSISAFANAMGGELYIGIKENSNTDGTKTRTWDGFRNIEEANAHIQTFEQLFPLGDYFTYNFLEHPASSGLVLQVLILKTKEIINSSDRIPYIRRGAQNLPVNTPEALERLRLDKGLDSFETRTIGIDKKSITDSYTIFNFLYQVIPTTEPEPWLRKQFLLRDENPTVAGVLLFSDSPQAILPKQCGIKIYRYSTKGEPTRETLAFQPISMEGTLYDLIYTAIKETAKIVEDISILTDYGLEKAKYPTETLHEIITNAVIHRDYSIPADIHIRIFDNRIEVENPGKLPGHITTKNILTEQFARNGAVVRIINKFPNPPNKDVGEGLNTAFDAMKRMRLKQPIIEEKENSVLVTIKHESLASPEDAVMEYLGKNSEITNTIGRELTGITSENTMKNVFVRLKDRNLIEQVPEKKGPSSSWRLKK
jgi:ATP-dependent DNA helicase RecG